MDNHITNTTGTSQNYLSYLMRLLRTQSGEIEVWRVSLEEPLTEQVHRFDDLHSLFTFLMAQTGHAGHVGGNGDSCIEEKSKSQTAEEKETKC